MALEINNKKNIITKINKNASLFVLLGTLALFILSALNLSNVGVIVFFMGLASFLVCKVACKVILRKINKEDNN